MFKRLFLLFCFTFLFLPLLSFGAVKSRQTVSSMLPVGVKAPNFALPDQNGKVRRLSDYKWKIVLLAFYPADFTKGCTMEAHLLTSNYKKFLAEGVTVIGISVQTPQSHKAFCEKEGIRQTLLADTKGKVASLYGVLGPGVSNFPGQAWYAHPKEYAELYSKYNPQASSGLAKRVTFIIGKNGKIAYVDPDVNSHLLTCAKDWLTWIKTHRTSVDGSALEKVVQ